MGTIRIEYFTVSLHLALFFSHGIFLHYSIYSAGYFFIVIVKVKKE